MGVIESHNNYLLITYYVLGRVNKMEQIPVTRHFQIESGLNKRDVGRSV